MKPNQKGDLGEVAITLDMMRQGLSVFAQVGHGSRVDLIAMDSNGSLYRIQCKYTSVVNDKALLELYKSTLNPRYNYHYSADDADIFALYVAEWQSVAYMPSSEIFIGKDRAKSITFRRDLPAGRCQHPTRLISDYSAFPIRPFEQKPIA